MRGNILVVGAVIVSTAFTLVTGGLLRPDHAKWAFEHLSYPLLWANVLLLVALLVDMRKKGELPAPARREVAASIAIAAAGAALTYFALPRAFRVLSDETNLLSTSLSMYLHQMATNITESTYHHDVFTVIAEGDPSRPNLFPFLISLLHTAFGFDPRHGFVVSAAAAAGVLVVVANFGRHIVSRGFGLLAAAMVAAFPCFQLAATSTGFESLNLLVITLIAVQAWAAWVYPSARRLELLVILCVLGAQCRYETAVFLVPAALVCMGRWRALLTQPSLRLVVYPLFMLPLLWQRRLTSVLNGPGEREAFSLRNVPSHIRHFLEFLWGPTRDGYATLWPIALLAGVGALLVIWRWSRSKTLQERRNVGLVLAALGMGLVLLVQTSFYLGDVRLAYQSRFVVSYAGVIGMLAAYPCYLFARRGPAPSIVAAGLASFLLVWGVSVANTNERGKTLNLFRAYQRDLALLESYPRTSTLVVAERPGLYAAQMYAAVGFEYAQHHNSDLRMSLQNRRWQSVLVFREQPCTADAIGLELGSSALTDVVLEYHYNDAMCVRVVRHRPSDPRPAPRSDEMTADSRSP